MKKIINPWTNIEGYNCFACAPGNKHGLKMEFYEDGDDVVSQWKPDPCFQGWLDTLHGGIQAVLLDEIGGWVIIRKMQCTGVTSKMETRYLKPVNIKDPFLTIRARIVETRRNLVTIEAFLYNAGNELCSRSKMTYFTYPRKQEDIEMGINECKVEGE